MVNVYLAELFKFAFIIIIGAIALDRWRSVYALFVGEIIAMLLILIFLESFNNGFGWIP